MEGLARRSDLGSPATYGQEHGNGRRGEEHDRDAEGRNDFSADHAERDDYFVDAAGVAENDGGYDAGRYSRRSVLGQYVQRTRHLDDQHSL